MRRVLITLVTVSLAAVAHAGSGPYFLEVTGAYNRLEMGTVNEFLDSVNEEAGQTVVDRLEAGGPSAPLQRVCEDVAVFGQLTCRFIADKDLDRVPECLSDRWLEDTTLSGSPTISCGVKVMNSYALVFRIWF